MSALAAAGAAVLTGPGGEDRAWGQWLAGRIDPGWRPGEWDPRAWLFTGDPANPRTGVWPCRVVACVSDVNGPSSWCTPCLRDLAASGQDRGEFAATHVPPRRRLAPGAAGALCVVSRGGTGCCRPAISHHGLCQSHYPSWRYQELREGGPAVPLARWAASVAVPYEGPLDCLVPGCGGRPVNDHSLCRLHWSQWTKGNRPKPERERERVPAGQRARGQVPFLGARRFSLAALEPLARLEVLYGLQHRDELGHILRPKAVRAVIRAAEGVASVRGRERELAGGESPESNVAALARQLCWSAGLGFDEFRGVAPIDKDVLDLRAVGLRPAGRPRHGGTADLTRISQPWLRELFRRWVEAGYPHSYDFGWQLRAVTIASRALASRPGGGDDPAALRLADMNAVADGFRGASRLDGAPYSAKHRGMLLGRFAGLLDFGRLAGLLDGLAGSFARHRGHVIAREEASEDEIGKAIPEAVIAQLDEHLDVLGEGFPCYAEWPAADVRAMLRCVYVVLRDTGRRPHEVASLPRDCLEAIDGETSLIWHNKKGRRNGRRLPVTAGTALEIRAWQERRAAVPAPPRGGAFLFPAITAAAAEPHMDPSNIWLALRGWVAALPGLHCGAAGEDGALVPFDRSKIFPYAFRHTYAQRHADAGTPVDVLKELMDHASVVTTMGYFQVSLKRKQAAVRALSAHAVDRHGRPAPFRSPLAYQISSVAVPYGGCTEPRNVKAGGAACPIRFQCAGCGFYRPDPSYLPAIEQHISELKADREAAGAMDAAGYVITNLTDQVTAYAEVAATMRKTLASLPAAERAAIEDAAAVMRKARAAAARTPVPPAGSSGGQAGTP